jgi:16S rRNA (uracil1498-N3)-methyltransferase
MARFYCPTPLTIAAELALPATAARHVQVLRLQPGATITLFNGEGGEHRATVLRMGRAEVSVRVDSHHAIEREPARAVHLAVGMPANDRMDWLVEKATELGVASIQPLHTAHSVLRLAGERATKKQAHWQSVAIAACEQCGGNRVPLVHPVQDIAAWLKCRAVSEHADWLRCVLSLAADTERSGRRAVIGRGRAGPTGRVRPDRPRSARVAVRNCGTGRAGDLHQHRAAVNAHQSTGAAQRRHITCARSTCR